LTGDASWQRAFRSGNLGSPALSEWGLNPEAARRGPHSLKLRKNSLPKSRFVFKWLTTRFNWFVIGG
jgi:hypothetical protein